MNRKAVRNSRSEKNEDFFQRKQLFNTKLLRRPIKIQKSQLANICNSGYIFYRTIGDFQ